MQKVKSDFAKIPATQHLFDDVSLRARTSCQGHWQNVQIKPEKRKDQKKFVDNTMLFYQVGVQLSLS